MNAPKPAEGRKGAFYLRNRTNLLTATQRVLATKGQEAKLEDFAAEADMAVSTIYKHFPNREKLVEAAVVEAMLEWERDIFTATDSLTDPLQRLITPMQSFLNMKTTHPLFAEIIARNQDLTFKLAPVTTGNLATHILNLAKSGDLVIDFPEIRTRNLVACLFAALQDQLNNPKAKLSDNLKSLTIALEMLGISNKRASDLLNL